MSGQPERLWTVRLTFEQELLFQHIEADSEAEAIVIAEDLLKNPGSYVVEDENITSADADAEEEETMPELDNGQP